MFLFLKFNPEVSFLYLPFVIITCFYLIITFIIGVFGKKFNYKFHQKLIREIQPESLDESVRPTIDIYYPTCGEDYDVQLNAIFAIVDLQKRWGINCHIYILDDSSDSSSHKVYQRAKLRTNNIHYIRRENRGYLKKAGNLRHAFGKTKGEYIAIFDADFVPSSNFFENTLPYFFYDETIGIVQTPQFFDPDDQKTWVSKGTAYVQELFYRLIQVSRNNFDGSICVGTCGLYSRKCLEPFGGTADIAYSEDVRTGFRITTIGFKVRYIPLVLSKGLCPDTLPAFFLQQHRWALGSIDLFFSKEFWLNKLTIMQRFCYLSGMLYYISTGLSVLFINIPSIYLLLFKPHLILIFNAVFSLPSFLIGTAFNAYWSKFEWGIHAMMSRQVSYYANLFAFIEKLTGNITPWQATGIAKKTKVYSNFQHLIFWNSIITYSFVIFCIGQHIEHGILNFLPTIFFQTINLYISLRILRDQI